MNGLILKGVGGFYTILDNDGVQYICKARGKFRKDAVSPVPGDYVDFSWAENDIGRIENIRERKNLLPRPSVANIDKLFIVMAASFPAPDMLLTDKLILQCELFNIRPVLIINKCDQRDDIGEAMLEEYAETGYSFIKTSTVTGEGIENVKAEINGSICCFAGQSAVGKSSLLNCILPELHTLTGELSRKTERGKHTTRHAELWPAFGGAILDTPGFSLFDLPDIEPCELSKLYPEMRPYLGLCRFSECIHDKEPDCAVKEALLGKSITARRYERYLTLLHELTEKRKHKYD